MTTDRDFDRLARAWLDLGPDEAPDRVIASVLQAAETTPQVRRPIRWPVWRDFDMTRLPIFAATAAAVLVVLVGGAVFLARSGPSGIGAPSASPTAVPTPTASASGAADRVPSALSYTWIGPKRTIADMPLNDRYRFTLTDTSMSFPNDTFTASWFASMASSPVPGQLRLVASGSVTGCHDGDDGRYTWSLSPGGSRLTLQAVNDACPTRQAALVGDWTRVACINTDDGCYGNLEAGTYSSQYFAPRLAPRVSDASWRPDFGAMTYTVPAGWANSADWPTTFNLTPSTDYALETKDGPPPDTYNGIFLFANPAATTQNPTCANAEQTAVPKTAEGLIGWVRGLSSVVTTAPVPITIDGHTGEWIDVKRAPTWTTTCQDPAHPTASQVPTAVFLSESGNDAGGWDLYLAGAEQQRLIILDLGTAQSHTIAIAIDTTDPSRFDELVTQAMPIVSSFTFK